MRRVLAIALATLVGSALTLPAAATAAPHPAAPTAKLARFGGFGRSYRPYRPRGYGYRPHRYRRGHGFLHGLFWGWMLSHFFGGGFALFWIVLLAFAWLMVRQRRGRAGY